ncbi:MAG: sirohydrochlorin chelatase, partial [Mycobacteriaceae bacterium]|nr:sirohydrochlorin chelatase [Mycobacteriaceae bacterium]
MRAARLMHPVLMVTAHGSADPRSAATTYAVAEQIRLLRTDLDVRVAFCEKNTPNLRDALAALDGPAIVTPLLLASAYHARVDIPALIAGAVAERSIQVSQAETLGEDPRLVKLLHQRIEECTADEDPVGLGVLVVAVGSSDHAANARTARVAEALTHLGTWAGVQMAFATGPSPTVGDGIEQLRRLGARRVVFAPWFIAQGRITDRLAATAGQAGAVAMAEPLGAHPLIAATVLDRFERARRR